MAASILAKHEREQHVAALREQHGDVGSGYPSDPVTQTFLEDYVDTHGELPACARRSWQTSQDALNAAAQTELGAYGTE
jgi:RNase HII (EC 3.1.26.4)